MCFVSNSISLRILDTHQISLNHLFKTKKGKHLFTFLDMKLMKEKKNAFDFDYITDSKKILFDNFAERSILFKTKKDVILRLIFESKENKTPH